MPETTGERRPVVADRVRRVAKLLALGNVLWPAVCVMALPWLAPRPDPVQPLPPATSRPEPAITSGADLPAPPSEWVEPLTPAGGASTVPPWSPPPATAAPEPSAVPTPSLTPATTPTVAPTTAPDPEPTVAPTETPEPEPTPTGGTDAKIGEAPDGD